LLSQPLSSDAQIKSLQEVLKKILREEHLIKRIRKAYSVIAYATLKEMLGMENVNEQEVQALISSKGMRVNGQYVYTQAAGGSEDEGEEGSVEKFEISEERIKKMARVVQFLEQ
jgi:hypothetical protein